jgi:hypothetical protein
MFFLWLAHTYLLAHSDSDPDEERQQSPQDTSTNKGQRTIANATKWLLQYRRLTKLSTGVSSRLMRRLYIAVAIPKIIYGADTWYTPPTKPAGQTKNSGSAGALRNLQKVQRIATVAIAGVLRSSPTDLVDIHAGTLPIELTLLKVCHRAIARMLTLSYSHPLH